MSSLANASLFPILDKRSSEHAHFYCRDEIVWLSFAFLFGILFGAENEIPSKTDATYHHFFRMTHLGMAASQMTVKVNCIPNKCIRNYVANIVKSGQYFEAVLDQIANWYKEIKNLPPHTYFGIMREHVNNGKISSDAAISDGGLLIFAGIHNTMGNLEKMLYYAAMFPEVQEMVYNELKTHYDNYGGFRINEMNKLHIFRAFVYESMRRALAPKITLPKNTLQDTVIGGYRVPAGSLVFGNLYTIHRATKHWETPHEFNIQHFLDKDGKFKRNQNFMAFGSGKRDCMGQTLAVKILYSVLSSVLFRYKLNVPADEKD
eukprot:354469_1